MTDGSNTIKNTDSLRKGLSELFFGADGNIDRTWSKLEQIWQAWVEQTADVLAKHARLGIYVARHEDSAATWAARAEDFATKDHADMVRQCEAKRQHFLQSAAELKDEQRRFRDLLTSTWDIYCQSESLITRLNLQKIMLRALPKSKKEHAIAFVETAAGLLEVLRRTVPQTAVRPSSSTTGSHPKVLLSASGQPRDDLPILTDRLAALEASIFESFEQLLTDKSELDAEALPESLERLGSAVEELETITIAKGGAGQALDIDMAEQRQVFLDEAINRVDDAFRLLALTATYLKNKAV